MESTLYSNSPPGVSTFTISPTCFPSNAFPTGDSLEIFPFKLFASVEPTTPVIKPFVVKASNKDWLAALGLFVCPVIIIPDFECRGSWIDRVYDFFHSLFVYLFVGILVVLENSTKDLWEQNASDCNHYPMYWDYYHEMLL